MIPEIKVRVEEEKDFETIYEMTKEAFSGAEHSDGNEQELVNRLRKGAGYIKALSLVAVVDETVVGHIMFTKATIKNENQVFGTLALAPLAVAPAFQKNGVGKQLIEEGLKLAKTLGHESVIVLGSNAYYPKFGFIEASKFGVKAPFPVPSEHFMAIELKENGLEGVSGVVNYDAAFMG